MKPKPLPAQDYLRQCLIYDAITGELVWRKRPPHHFKGTSKQSAEHQRRAWNGANAGCPAFTCLTAEGYAAGAIDRVHHRAHRIIWKLVYGVDPQDVDHINGDKADNSLGNLRSVSRLENNRNARLRKDNTSGVVGVSPHAEGGWVAQIKGARKAYLGRFPTIEEAAAARLKAEREIGFHENHGRAA